MAKKISIHDRVFRSSMAKPEVTLEFFKNFLPANILNKIDIRSIKLQNDSFIDDKLRIKMTDLLYTANFDGELGYLYLLVEHQSTPDKLLPFRLLKE